MLDAAPRSWWGGIEMAPRKTRPASPASPAMTPRSVGAAPSAAEVPATSGTLAELAARLDRVATGLRDVKVGLADVQASLHGMNARLERVAFLVEEQNARNKVALDAVLSMLSRQNHLEQRVDNVEDTVRRLAAA